MLGKSACGLQLAVSKRAPGTIRKAGEPPGNPVRRLASVLRDLPRPAPREQRDLQDRRHWHGGVLGVLHAETVVSCASAAAAGGTRAVELRQPVRTAEDPQRQSHSRHAADSNEGGHLFQSHRGHHSNLRGGRLRRNSVSLPISGASAGGYRRVPLSRCHAGRAKPDRRDAPTTAAKFMLPLLAASDCSMHDPASERQGLSADVFRYRSKNTVPMKNVPEPRCHRHEDILLRI
jgi:hypothetical protein